VERVVWRRVEKITQYKSVTLDVWRGLNELYNNEWRGAEKNTKYQSVTGPQWHGVEKLSLIESVTLYFIINQYDRDATFLDLKL
jgi:hypothetical protein